MGLRAVMSLEYFDEYFNETRGNIILSAVDACKAFDRVKISAQLYCTVSLLIACYKLLLIWNTAIHV